MAEGQVAPVIEHFQRLHIVGHAGPGGGIPYMAGGNAAVQALQAVLEHIVHQSHALFDVHVPAVGDSDAGAFLASVLECEQPPVGIQCHVVFLGIDAEDPAFFMELVFRKKLVPHSSSRFLMLWQRRLWQQPVFPLWLSLLPSSWPGLPPVWSPVPDTSPPGSPRRRWRHSWPR